MTDALAAHASSLVPTSYAEKAMASLMQLHGELMDEKERRVDLFRRLMEREQALAELKLYVRVLEEKLGTQAPSAPEPAATVQSSAAAQIPPPPSPPRARPETSVRPRPPVPPQVGRSMGEGWRAW